MKVEDSKILIVDDEEHIINVLKLILKSYFKNILTAQNGAEALNIINKEKNISCVLSDINMPIMDGISLIKNVRKTKNDVPFIFFTAYGNEQLMLEAIKYGAFDFVDKPYFDNLEKIVKKAVESNFSKEDKEQQKDDFITNYQKLLNEKKE